MQEQKQHSATNAQEQHPHAFQFLMLRPLRPSGSMYDGLSLIALALDIGAGALRADGGVSLWS
jgi:hypothetical protein